MSSRVLPDGAGLLVYHRVTGQHSKLKLVISKAPVRHGNIANLEAFGVEVVWNEYGTIDDVQRAIADGYVPIIFLRTGELPYWDQDTPHAVVVVGVEASTVLVSDPAFENAPIPVPAGDFELAWDEFGCQWAAIKRSPR